MICPVPLLSFVARLALGSLPPPPTAPLATLAPGQTGVCYTVFAGDVPEPMTFAVRGVLPNYLGPGRDVLLVRLTGERPEFTGVVSGMSGSPCFVDGKLVGALGYSFAKFAKEPIAGIMPIADMLSVWDQPTGPLPWRLPMDNAAVAAASAARSAPGAAAPTPAPRRWPSARHVATFGDGPLADVAAAPLAAAADGFGSLAGDAAFVAAAGGSALRPLATPLTVAGVRSEILAPFAAGLRAAGLMPQLGGAATASAASRPPQPLVPGGAVAAVLVRGDVDIAATGTVTWVDGPRVLAFGHPFMGHGPTSLPMANAHVVHTMASTQHSFKMTVTGATVGEVVHDRLSAIGGVMGQSARMVAVRGQVRRGKARAPFALEVVRSPALTPQFLMVALAGALDHRVEAISHGTVRLTAKLRVGGAPEVTVRQVLVGHGDDQLMARVALAVARSFDLLWNAPDDATPGDAALDVDVALDDAPQQEDVEALHLDAARVRPGETVHAAVQLRRQDAPPAVVRLAFAVPAQWAGEDVTLVAAGAAAAEQLLQQRLGAPTPRNRAQVAGWIAGQRASDAVYLLALRNKPSLQHDGVSYAGLPPSTTVLLAHARHHALQPEGLALELRAARAGRVDGQATSQLQVAHAP